MWCCRGRAANQPHTEDCERHHPAGVCYNHRVIAHDAEGLLCWCDFCGKDADGVQVHRAAGGWGTVSGNRD